MGRIRRNCHYLVLLCFILLPTACSISLGPEADSKKYYVIEESSSNKTVSAFSLELPYHLRVREMVSSRFVGSQRIIFSSDSQTRGYYQFSYWVDPPPKRLGFFLESALDLSGIFDSVFRESSAVAADFELSTEIIDFYHFTGEQPGEVRISVRAELVSLSEREVVSRKKFSERLKVASYDVEGAVQAFSKGSHKIVDRIVEWLASSLEEKHLSRAEFPKH